MLGPRPLIVVPFVSLAALGAAISCGDGKVITGPVVDIRFPDAGAPPQGGAGGGVGIAPDGAVIVPGGAGIGDDCGEDTPCRPGLACTAGVCEPGRAFADGDACILGADCQDGLQCVGSVCTSAGAGQEGDPCADDTGCATGFRCGLVGFAAQCVVEGTADVGDGCDLSGDCYSGLLCAGAATGCAPAPPGVPAFGLPTSPEITCADPSDGRVVAHFEVPGADGADPAGDFFRLPFPNDVRLKSGRVDLSGFPTPGVSPLVGFDPIQVYVDALERDARGWGLYPTIHFRFSGPVDFDTFRANDTTGENPLAWIDVTDPAAPRNRGMRWSATSSGNNYICHNWVAMRRHHGSPLEPGRTYAIYMSDAIRDKNGQPVQRDAHFDAMMAASAPSDAALATAWNAYAPMRAHFEVEGIDPATILNGVVITTEPALQPMETLAADVMAAQAPTASGWMKCDGSAVSPCPQAEDSRACGSGGSSYDEYHALVDLPIFQAGDAPYLDSGGGIVSGAPQRTEQVCVSLTVPKSAPPAGGFPLVVYGHGTGGSFRSHVRPEVAGALSAASTPSGTVAMAVLGYDAVQHGPRRGDSTDSPNNLFFNFKNPDAARGNPLQGAADVISMGRLAQALTVPGSATGAADVTIDPAHVVYYGHSQGSIHGSLGLPYTSVYGATVLSGNGASLMHSLVNKTAPVNIAGAVPIVIGDFDSKGQLPGGEMHPALNLLQQWIDPADPLHFAQLIARAPIDTVGPKSVFQTYGLGDSYSPPITMETYAVAADLMVAASDPSVATPDDIGNASEQPVPLVDNVVVNTVNLTLALRQYQAPADSDGHFVVFDVPSATADVARFLGMAASGEIPQVGQ